MSLENAKQNLKEFGKELNLEGLVFDENFTCILGIDNTFSLHLTYNSDRLYLYSPVLDGLPKDEKILLRLYVALLEGSMLGGQMAGGGVGLAVPEELILMHAVIEMGPGTDTKALCRFAPVFVDAVEKWRDKVKRICEGQHVPKEGPPTVPPTPGHGHGHGHGHGPHGHGHGQGERFIKI